eukprot:2569952-Pleurochrysis_carterae.AAC.2
MHQVGMAIEPYWRCRVRLSQSDSYFSAHHATENILSSSHLYQFGLKPVHRASKHRDWVGSGILVTSKPTERGAGVKATQSHIIAHLKGTGQRLNHA